MDLSRTFPPFFSHWFPSMATAPADIRQHGVARNQELDAVFLYGPDIGCLTKRHVEEECRRLHMSSEVFDIAGAGSMDNLRLHLHGGNKLGPNTQLS